MVKNYCAPERKTLVSAEPPPRKNWLPLSKLPRKRRPVFSKGLSRVQRPRTILYAPNHIRLLGLLSGWECCWDYLLRAAHDRRGPNSHVGAAGPPYQRHHPGRAAEPG